eukprot:8458440-Pyramimonas_sp.AAC.1
MPPACAAGRNWPACTGRAGAACHRPATVQTHPGRRPRNRPAYAEGASSSPPWRRLRATRRLIHEAEHQARGRRRMMTRGP